MLPAWWTVGAVSGAAAVAFGAFGAHALSGIEPKLLKTWETAAHYHLVHSVAIIVAGQAKHSTAAALLTAGTVILSGSLYALVLTGQRKLGAVTPIGGLLMIAGWLALVPWTGSSGADRKAH